MVDLSDIKAVRERWYQLFTITDHKYTELERKEYRRLVEAIEAYEAQRMNISILGKGKHG